LSARVPGHIPVDQLKGEAFMKKKVLAALFAGLLVFGGVACDDSADNTDTMDEDDSRTGPGDGNDETGPGR
jgi:hypothetical protein